MKYHQRPLPIKEAPNIAFVFNLNTQRAHDILCDLGDSLARMMDQGVAMVTVPALMNESAFNLKTPSELMLATMVAAGIVMQNTGLQPLFPEEAAEPVTVELDA